MYASTSDNLLLRQLVSKGGHPALEVWLARNRATVPHDPIKDAIGVMPRMAIAVQGWRIQRSVRITALPVRVSLPGVAMTDRAVLPRTLSSPRQYQTRRALPESLLRYSPQSRWSSQCRL